MKRREILIGLAALATRTPAWAQTGARLPIVGFVGLASAQIDNHMLGHFQAGLRELGRIEGRTIAIEARIADGNIDKGHELISELVMLPVDVFLSPRPRGKYFGGQSWLVNQSPYYVAGYAEQRQTRKRRPY